MPYNAILKVDFDSVDYSGLVTVAEAKVWCAISGASFDTLLQSIINTACKQCEDFVNKAFTEREAVVILRNELGYCKIPYTPIVDVVSVKNKEDVEVDYEMYADSIETPTVDYLKVTYNCGFETLDEIYKTAIKNKVLWLFDNRGDESILNTLSPAAKLILTPYRVVV